MAHSLECETPCWLLDKTPPEVRLMIFRLALRTPHGIAKRPGVIEDRANETNAIIRTSLFLVNRLVSEESQDAFYLEHMIRLTNSVRTVYGNKHLREVEIAGKIASYFCDGHWALDQKHKALARLPKLQSITLTCDSLHKRKTTVRDFINRALPDGKLHCRAIGLFQLLLPSIGQTKIYIRNNALTHLLPDANKLAAQQSLPAVANLGHLESDMEAKNKLAYAIWLKWHELYLLKTRDPEAFHEMLDPTEVIKHQLMDARMEEYLPMCAHPWVHPQLPNGVRIGDLTVEEHGVELVEWASDLMAS